MRSWAPEERLAFLAALGSLLLGLLALGLRAEFGPVGEWGCAWRVERGNATAPALTGSTLEEARAALDDAQPCVGLRVVGNGSRESSAVVRGQNPAPGNELSRRTLDVVVG
jgi:PASTA domain